MNFKRLFTRRRVIIAGIVGVGMCLLGGAWELWWTPKRSFRSCATAGCVEGINVLGVHSEDCKDMVYSWRLKHEAEVLAGILASLPFHPCDQSDTEWLQHMFPEKFELGGRKLEGYLAYRGGVGRKSEYILIAPDKKESIYLLME